MGLIIIKTAGSFGESEKVFSAHKHGHAHAVAQAMQHLSGGLLPESIEADHRLHDLNEKPSEGFDKPE